MTRPDWLVSPGRPSRLLWLDKNENLDPALKEVTGRLLAELDPLTLCTYPECGPLYRKLSAFVDLPPDHLILSAGSDGAIRYVFEAFVNPGDVVVHTVPTFAMYSVYSAIYGAQTVPLEYRATEIGPRLDAAQVRETIERARPRLVCLPNPDSPTGTVFTESELRLIIETALSLGAVVLIDEAYHPFYDRTAIAWVRQYKNLVVARTFAKAWGLAGLRIGYAAASPELASYLHKVRPMYEVNTLAVAFMEKMLDHHQDMLASVQRLNAGKAQFLDSMERLGFRTLHGHGNFLHVSFGSQAHKIHEALKDLVLYRLDFKEPCLIGFSRFSSTTPVLFDPIIRKITEVSRNEVQ